jgi:hypothetical protein
MAEYLIQSEDLTSIADKIRVLSGTEDDMSLGTMETKLDEANVDVNTEADLISQIMVVLNNKTDIVIPEVKIGTATAKLSSNGTSISFTGLTEEPEMFAISPTGNITLGSTRYVTSVMYDGSTTRGTYGYRSGSSATSYHSSSYFTWTYSNGTLTVKTSSSTNGGNFSSSVTYQLAYVTTTEGSLGGNTSNGVQLPTLTNEGTAADLMSGKQLIDSNGNVITGTHECGTSDGPAISYVFQNGVSNFGSFVGMDDTEDYHDSYSAIENGEIVIYVEGSMTAHFYMSQAVDLSAFSKLIFVVSEMYTEDTSKSGVFKYGISQRANSTSLLASGSTTVRTSSSSKEYSVDLSSVNGSYYITANVARTVNSSKDVVVISEIRLEK